MDIKNNEKSIYYQPSKRPPKFALKEFKEDVEIASNEDLVNEGNIMDSINFSIDEKYVVFPELNDEFSIEDLARIYRDIEKGKSDKQPIYTKSSFNVIPSAIKGECKAGLIGIIIDKKDFERRMSSILASHIRCKHKIVILAVCYWDGIAWEITWKKPFEAVGGEVYRQMYDGEPERII